MKLGIDFGTTHTVVALVDRGNYPVVAFEGGSFVPSVIAVRERDGDLRFGTEAAAAGHQKGWRTLRSFKRLLNEAGPRTTVEVAGRSFPIMDLLIYYFSNLKWELTNRSNLGLRRGETLEAAVSLPANSLGAQRFLTVDAFRRAGFEVTVVLNEPSASGFEYADRFRQTVTSRREYVLIYDLGGGTFDASLIHMASGANEVVSTAGVQRLGGDDFDEAILALVLERLGAPSLSEDEREALLDECRRAKEGVEPNTRRFVVDLSPVGRPPLVLPVEEVYESCLPLVERTVETMAPLVSEMEAHGGVSWHELAGVYTVGGASGFPPVWRRLRERFGASRVRRSLEPFAATAIGLAIYLEGGSGIGLKDRLTRHFGVWRESDEGRGVRYDVIFARDERIPAPDEHPLEARRTYRAAHNLGWFRFVECSRMRDGAPAGDILPWEEVLFPFDPALRGVKNLSAVPVSRLPEPGPEVEELYRLGSAGMVEVTITVRDDGFSNTFRITPAGRKKR